MARERIRTEAVGLRLSAKTKYGLELLARKERDTLTGLLTRGAEALLKQGGIAADLERLWDDDPLVRARNLEKLMPDLMTDNERHALTLLEFDGTHEAAARALLK